MTLGFNSGFGGITSTFMNNPRLQPCRTTASTSALPISCADTTSNGNIFDIAYDFGLGNGDNGNVLNIVNFKDTTRNQSFGYDSVNRLTSAQNAGSDCNPRTVNDKTKYWGNSYTYDEWGNLNQKIITKCGAENLSVVSLTNNQLTGYGYDAAGNTTSDPTDSVTSTYDQENRISVATKNGVATSYVYDAAGNRVQKSNGASGTLYWYMTPGIVAESDLSGNSTAEYMFFAGERIARKDFPSNAVSYYFSDHLETASVITDASGHINAESDYYPWGGELQFVNNDSNHYKFTGKERDDETGLDYFGARYYSNGLGRFVSGDLKRFALRHLLNPQKLNKYSYVLNNPLALIDPDGLEEFRVFVRFNPGDPAPKNSPNWSAIQTNAQQHGNTVKVFQGDAATSQNYQSSLSSAGTTVFIGHTQLVDNGGGPKVAAVSLSDKEVGQPATKASEIGAGRVADPPAGLIGALPTNIPAEMPANVNGGTIAIFGCDSTGLASQYPGAGTFVGVDTMASTDGLLNADGAFVNSAASGNTVDRAVTDANSQINQIPNLDKNAHVQAVPKKEEGPK
jgi:RHS repeat-associated protein